MNDSERYDLMIDEIDSLKRENKALQEQVAAKETTLGGTYIDINTHFRDIEKLKSEITALQDKLERGELVEVIKSTWVESNPHNSDKFRRIECGNCGNMWTVSTNVDYETWIYNRNYCAECGVKMERSDTNA